MIEMRGRRILLDGRPSLVLSGEVHYFRVARDEWADRLDRVLEVGCTCVASYIPWLFHELPDGSIDLTGRTRPERDLGAFIDLCAERGLDFFARPGPFVMAELKNEGLPYRLYSEHPEIVPVGWDGEPAPTRDGRLPGAGVPGRGRPLVRRGDAGPGVAVGRRRRAGARRPAGQRGRHAGLGHQLARPDRRPAGGLPAVECGALRHAPRARYPMTCALA